MTIFRRVQDELSNGSYCLLEHKYSLLSKSNISKYLYTDEAKKIAHKEELEKVGWFHINTDDNSIVLNDEEGNEISYPYSEFAKFY